MSRWVKYKHQALLLTTVLAFALSMLMGLTKLIYEAREDQGQFKELVYWSAAQLDREFWRFLEALSRYSQGEGAVSRDDLFLRYDILLSRVAVFDEGEVGRRLAAIEGTTETLAAFAATVQALEPDLQALRPGDYDAAAAIRTRVAPHVVALFQLAQRINLHEQAHSAEFRLKTAGTYWILSALLLGVCATGTLLIVLLIKEVRRGNGLLLAANAAERRAQESEQRVQGIVATVTDGILTANIDGIVETVNPAVEKLFGIEASRIVGRNVSMLMPQHLREAHTGYLTRYKETGETKVIGRIRQLEACRGDGTTFPVELSVGDLRRGDDHLIVGVVRDITQRKRAEAALREAHDTLEQRVQQRTEELERKGADLVRLAEDLGHARDQAEAANRAKSEFLAAMSHELRTPLNAIIGFSEVIKEEMLGPVGSTKYRDYADDINESGQHLLSLINDILDLSKIDSGVDEIHEEDINVPEVLRAVRVLVKERASRAGIGLEFECPDDLPALRVDARKLKQILVNLLSNAIKFTPAGGDVTLKAWFRGESGHVFQVIDTGIGIAREDIPKALTLFQQVDSELSRKFEGTGLGLPLTKALVELHGGSLDLQSELNVGSTVTVRFPTTRIVQSLHGRQLIGVYSSAAR